jgi:hypothetical protein
LATSVGVVTRQVCGAGRCGTIGGELAIGRDHRAAALYSVGSRVEPHHDVH